MPVRRVKVGKKVGYRYGKRGKLYTYKPGNEASRKRAKRKAYIQGYAIKKAGGK